MYLIFYIFFISPSPHSLIFSLSPLSLVLSLPQSTNQSSVTLSPPINSLITNHRYPTYGDHCKSSELSRTPKLIVRKKKKKNGGCSLRSLGKPQRRRLVEINKQTTTNETQKRRHGGAIRDMMSGSGGSDSNSKGRSLRYSLNLIRGRWVRLGGDTVDDFDEWVLIGIDLWVLIGLMVAEILMSGLMMESGYWLGWWWLGID